ncbi:MAG: UvrD-helicase domain-containing protein [Bacilli bacterium]
MLKNLNDEQLSAVTTIDGSLLVLAGAGSGKTKVLTTRIAYLIEQGINENNILAITFTNKAAKEMKNRLTKLISQSAYNMQISTFHAFGLVIIKENYELIGYKNNFTILDSDDSLTLIKKILKDLEIDPKIHSPKAIKNAISGAKNELIDYQHYEKSVENEFEEIVLKVYQRYQKRLKTNNSFDFDDLLMMPIQILKENPKVLQQYQQQYRYILVDEYQDTNEAQYLLIKMISAKYKNICVVGDPDQTIFSWRGANYKNILNFENDYKNTKVVKLEKNYRSTMNILNAANCIIERNKQRKEKKLWTDSEEGSKIVCHQSIDERDEAYYVVKEIKRLISKANSLDEIAVLYRTNAQSRNVEEALLKENVNYKIVGGFSFYNRKEIKDLVAYLKIIYNQDDDLNLLRVINVPKRGIGLKTISNLTSKANSENKSIYNAIEFGKELHFKKIIEHLIALKDTCSLTEMVDAVLEFSGLKAELENEKTIEADVRLENLEEFKSITKTFEEKNGIISLEEFLMEISLVTDVEVTNDTNEKVTLMTVHSAKGLEFDNIFIVGLEEGIFPHSNSFDDGLQLEEERRLCYVGITRARKNVFLVNAKQRTLFGMTSYNAPSRFINEIDKQFLKMETPKIITKFKRDNLINDDINYNIGDHIMHERYDEGVVVGVEKSVLTIAFTHPYGIKQVIKGHKSYRKV